MKITADMTIAQVVSAYPHVLRVLYDFGLGCVGCPSSQFETIEEASYVHGFEAEELLQELNDALNDIEEEEES